MENVSIQSGGKPVIWKFLAVTMEQGDEVLYPSPGYPIYESMIRYLGGVPVPYSYQYVVAFKAPIIILSTIFYALALPMVDLHSKQPDDWPLISNCFSFRLLILFDYVTANLSLIPTSHHAERLREDSNST